VVLAAAILIGWLVMRRNSGATSENGKPASAQIESVPKQPSLPPQAAPQKPSPAIESNAPARSGRKNENETSGANPEVSQPTIAANDEIVRQVLPNVPRSARDTITGTIKVGVKVSVDRQGNVSDAELTNSGPSKYFARLAMEAAKKWQFQPTQNAKSWLLRFEFRRSGTTVHPVQAKG
jgi:TonB family protein